MDWKNIINETISKVKQLKRDLYPDKSWRYEGIPTRAELKQYQKLLSTIEKDFKWLDDYKSTKKQPRRIRLVKVNDKMESFVGMNKRGLNGYPENYLLAFHILYFYRHGVIKGNVVDTEKFNAVLKDLYPNLKGSMNFFKMQTEIKKHIVVDENKKRIIVECDKNALENEIKQLDKLKSLKQNYDDFLLEWDKYYKA